MFDFLKSDFQKLMDAIKEGDTTKACKLVDKVDNLEQQDKNGNTALILVACENLDTVAEKLISKMNSVDQQNLYKSTALGLAVEKSNYHIVEKLLDKKGGYEKVLMEMIENEQEDTARGIVFLKEQNDARKALMEQQNDARKALMEQPNEAKIKAYLLPNLKERSELQSKFNELFKRADHETLLRVYGAADEIVHQYCVTKKGINNK